MGRGLPVHVDRLTKSLAFVATAVAFMVFGARTLDVMSNPEDLEDTMRRMAPVKLEQGNRAFMTAVTDLLRTMVRKGASGIKLVDAQGQTIPLPEILVHVLNRAAAILARGDGLMVVPDDREVTTQQAAEMLNISRQHLVTLLERGELPYHKTGKHRRLQVTDVLLYKQRQRG